MGPIPAGGSCSSWMRVALGVEKVFKAIVEQKIDPSAILVVPTLHHFPDLLASYQKAILQAASSLSKTAKSKERFRTGRKYPIREPDPFSTSTQTSSFQPPPPPSPPPIQPLTIAAADVSFNTVHSAQPLSQPGVSATSSLFKKDVPSQSSVVSTRTLNTISIGGDYATSSFINSGAQNGGGEQVSLESLASHAATEQSSSTDQEAQEPLQDDQRTVKEGSAVPSTRVGRALGFANLGIGLFMGSITESARRLLRNEPLHSSTVLVNNTNSDRVASSLCRMRGAALKMGQMLSIQDESLLPPALSRALQQVRQGADAMPRYQLEQQLIAQLGSDWRTKFVDFDMHAFAAASIGQVHRATIRRVIRDREIAQPVVVKVQYPGVAQSIESDLRNLAMLVAWSGLSPKGLFIENVIRVGRDELVVECDYRRELENQQRMKHLVESDPLLSENKFRVPDVFAEFSTSEIITSEYIPGGTIDKIATVASQQERNRIGKVILYLTMKELFDWQFMQTDPNWGNFLYDVGTSTTSLIDFGATREYSKKFVDGYLRIVWASATRDESTLMEQSYGMGFLTGKENASMLRAHKLSGFTVGEPFWKDVPFDFRASRISERMGEHTSVFLQHRLTAPPEEVYTLHRKLAGAYMLCIKLGAIVESPRAMLESIVSTHEFGDGKPNPITGR